MIDQRRPARRDARAADGLADGLTEGAVADDPGFEIARPRARPPRRAVASKARRAAKGGSVGMGVLYNAQHPMRKHRLPGVPARGSQGTDGANPAALFARLPYPENDREYQPAKAT